MSDSIQNFSHILTNLLEAETPRTMRLPGGLALAYTPPDEHGRARLTISRRGQFPSESDVALIDGRLRRILPPGIYQSLITSPPVLVGSDQDQHGTVGFTWYTYRQLALL